MEETTQVIFTLFSLLFLLIGLVLIKSILSALNPLDFVAITNAEKLRDSMELACNGEKQVIDLSVPQNVPALTSVATFATSWVVHQGGDPHYVLYYEAFPAGDAIGWESYFKFEPRALAYVPEGTEIKNVDDARNYMKRAGDKIAEEGVDANILVLQNVILSSDFPHYQQYSVDRRIRSGSTSDDLISEFFEFGSWKTEMTDPQNSENKIPYPGDNFFAFNNYNSLTDEEKTAIKYIPCGDHALCMKTRDGVYRYEMKNCKNAGIKYVALAYEERSVTGQWGTVAVGAGLTVAGGYFLIYGAPAALTTTSGVTFKVLKWVSKIPFAKTLIAAGVTYAGDKLAHYFLTTFAAYKSSDFSITSPCNIEKMEIEMVACDDIDPAYMCSELQRFELMTYDSEKGPSRTGQYHYTCAEKARKFDENAPDLSTVSLSGEQCLLVTVKELPEGYCWTPDPYKELSVDISFGGFKNLFTEPLTQAFARNLGITPVRDHLSYISDASLGNIMLLMPFTDNGYLVGRNSALISWGWPQHKGQGAVGDIFEGIDILTS